jgi:hypothetical protein
MADHSVTEAKLEVIKPLIAFKGAVLDLDGTLLDAEPLYFAAYKHAANSYVPRSAAVSSAGLIHPVTRLPRSTQFREGVHCEACPGKFAFCSLTIAAAQFEDAHCLIVGHPEVAGAALLVRHFGLDKQGVTPESFLAVSGHKTETPIVRIYTAPPPSPPPAFSRFVMSHSMSS